MGWGWGQSQVKSLMATSPEHSSVTFSLGDLSQVTRILGVMASCSVKWSKQFQPHEIAAGRKWVESVCQHKATLTAVWASCSMHVGKSAGSFLSSPACGKQSVPQRRQTTGLLTAAPISQGLHSYRHSAWNAFLTGPAPINYPNYFHLSRPPSPGSLS